jgi:hypothetical protein
LGLRWIERTPGLGAFVIAALLCGCAGGAGSTPKTSPTSVAAGTATGTFSIAIPTRTTASNVRYPQFVSPNAVSVTIVVNTAAPLIVDVSATSPLCTTSAGARTCSLAVNAAVGTDTFAITIYAAAGGTGTVLATASTSTPVVAGTPFSITVAMNAVLGTLVLAMQGAAFSGSCPNAPTGVTAVFEGCTGSATLVVSPFDPSGAPITGTQPYSAPIQLASGDAALNVAPAQLTAPGQTATITYAGAAFGASVTTSVSISASAGGQAAAITLPVERQYLYIANVNASNGVPATGGGDVEVFAFGASGIAPPARVLSGASTLMQVPADLLLDAAGELYVLDIGTAASPQPQVLVFAPGANGNVAPIRKITGLAAVNGSVQCEEMTLDPSGQNLLVNCDDEAIHVFPALGNGTATTLQEYSLQNGSWTYLIGAAFDAAHNLYVTDGSTNAIFEFAPPLPTSGTYTPIVAASTLGSTLWPAGVTPLDVRIDRRGNTIATIVNQNAAGPADAGNEVAIWHSGTLPCNNCAPSATFSGTPFSTHAPDDPSEDAAGNLYVSNSVTNQVFVFSSAQFTAAIGSVSNPAPLRTISTGANPSAPSTLAIGP